MKFTNLSNSLKVVKQNRLFSLATVILFLFFGAVVYYGGAQLYEREVKWRYENVDAQLTAAIHGIETYFSHPQNDLFFLRDLPNTNDYLASDFSNAHAKDEVRKTFYDFARIYEYYSQIKIIDSTGREVVRIKNEPDGTTTIIPDSDLKDERHQVYFQEAMKLDSGHIYVSEIKIDIERRKTESSQAAIITLATTLFNAKSEKVGILVLDIYLSGALRLLPANMFIQTEEGNSLSLKPDGTIDFKKSSYHFEGHQGEQVISEVEAIHHASVEFLPGKRWIVAVYHDHTMLKAESNRLTIISGVALLFFFVILLVISYINFSRHMKLIDAQRAIISSLAKLAEHRDSDTGRHLVRTAEYSTVLAKQLRENKKYRKMITDDFIDDLYYAAPLHDIGKVGIHDAILLKEGKLTSEEYEEMKGHVRIGEKVLQDVIDKFKLKQSFLIMGRDICAYHHEKYNGQGYPEGLTGPEIPVAARIFALCDAYDAIRSKRPYKSALPHEEAIARIKADRGEHFDPDIVDAFLKCEREFLRISTTY